MKVVVALEVGAKQRQGDGGTLRQRLLNDASTHMEAPPHELHWGVFALGYGVVAQADNGVLLGKRLLKPAQQVAW